MKFTLTNYQLTLLQEKNKLYSYIYNTFTKAYFKVARDSFTFMLRGDNGVLQTIIPIEYKEEPIYYSLEYNKWQTVLQKYENYEKLHISVTKNALKISAEGTTDSINLSLTTFSEDSHEATLLDNFINAKREGILQEDYRLVLNEELLDNLSFADTLFTTQGRVNAVGLGKNDITYSDRSVVLKAYFSKSLNDRLFDVLGENSYIHIHTSIIKLLPLLFKTNASIYFSSDYSILYWEDENTRIYIASPDREVALPTEAEFKGIQPPEGSPSFSVSPEDLKDCLNFFVGFYEGSAWKPLTFNITANKEISLYYKHPTTEITKVLPGAISTADGSFMIDSETLKKVVSKISDRAPDQEMTFYFDEDSLGIYLNVKDIYEVVFSKLTED